MVTEVVTFTEVSKKTGSTNKGPWTMFLFSNGNGGKFQTFDYGLGTKAEARIGQPLKIEYHPEERNGFVNNVLDAIHPFEEGSAEPWKDVDGGKTPAVPASAAAVAAAAAAAQQTTTGYQAVQDRQTIINRSAALARAIECVQAGVIEWGPDNKPTELFQLANAFVQYIEQGSQAFGQF